MTIRLHADRRRFLQFTSVVAFVGLALSGCGGHNGSSVDPNTSLTAVIHWPALSTATKQATAGITASSTAAIVCIISTTSGNTSNGDPIDFTPIVRSVSSAVPNADGSIPAYTDAFDQMWNSNTVTQNPQQVRTGANNIQVRFYAQNPTGTTSGVNNDLIPSSYSLLPSVGDSALIPITVAGSTMALGVFDPTTGAITGSIPVSTTIQSVQISPQTVSYGNTFPIPVTAYNASGTAVAPTLQSGAALFTQSSSSAVPTILNNGNVTPNGLGSTTVYATVDGIKSNTVTITSSVGDISGYKAQSGISYLDAAYSVIASGSTQAAVGSSISISYVGYFSNDPSLATSVSYTAFDTAYQTTPITVTVGSDNLVTGLDAGLVGMSVGTQRIIAVPPTLGYGTNQVGIVPGNSELYYIVTRTN